MQRPHVFSAEFWRSYWVAVRRSRRDKRDLGAVLRITLGLLLSVGYYGANLWNARAAFDEGTIGIVVFAGAVILGAWFLFWIQRRIDARSAIRYAESTVDKKLRKKLADDGFLIAILLARAGSEQMLKEKELPEQVTVVTRSGQIAMLRNLGK